MIQSVGLEYTKLILGAQRSMVHCRNSFAETLLFKNVLQNDKVQLFP